ncbi:Chloramphenicol acetyltransferase-like domain protein [Akanthomyces lecanii RCEF 1005]|uniref:Chloramphenicol acetyltransferase-like domain protein n=1 Tax=Akanthomyces lecanii RCEF 1005 TaxID=1081108 RepID=A0A162KVL0_CORDF|nr:Chloramphenicol acetyltransferase-like domain protein [Akanthomyces lecanii RCEF 1005]
MEEDDVYPIHLQDFNFRKLIMVCTLRFDHVLDAYKLHTALARLLEKSDWRKLGGRSDGKLEIHVPKKFSVKRPPVRFSHDDLTDTLVADHELASKLPFPTEGISVQPNQYNLIELGVAQDAPKTFDQMMDRDVPQMSLHIVSFQDATLVSIGWPHSVMGGQGFGDFLRAWSLMVEGRESEVPRLLGTKEDVLLQAENNDFAVPEEEWVVQKCRLIGINLILFLLRFVWSLFWTPQEVKTVFLPKKALNKLQLACRDEISSDTSLEVVGSGDKPYEDESVLLAYFARLAASTVYSHRPITLVNFLKGRQLLSSIRQENAGGVNVQNMTGYAFSFLTNKVASGSGLGVLVRENARHMREQSTEQQYLSFLRIYRRATQNGGTFKLFYGPRDAHVIVCNSFLEEDLLGTVNFEAAALTEHSTSGDTPPGTMTCLYYHIMNNRLGCGSDCIYLLGKDWAGNLWATAALPRKTWQNIDLALKHYD